MWDVLSAIIPPAVVAAVFCTAIYKLLRSEMAPRTSDGRRVGERSTTSGRESTSVATADESDGARGKQGPSGEDGETERDGGNAERD